MYEQAFTSISFLQRFPSFLFAATLHMFCFDTLPNVKDIHLWLVVIRTAQANRTLRWQTLGGVMGNVWHLGRKV